MKDESEGKTIGEFIGLKSKMYSILSDDGKESNTAKGVNIATGFNEFKAILFNKKVVRHKMRRFQSKKHKLGTYESSKYHYHVLMIKDLFQMMGFILLMKIIIETQIRTDDHKEKQIQKDSSKIRDSRDDYK